MAECAFPALLDDLPVEQLRIFAFERVPGIREDDGEPQSAAHPIAWFSGLSGSVPCRSRRESDESGNIHYGEVSWSSSRAAFFRDDRDGRLPRTPATMPSLEEEREYEKMRLQGAANAWEEVFPLGVSQEARAEVTLICVDQ